MRVLLIVYDNDSFIHAFPLGIGYIASVLMKEGVEVIIYNQDIHHYPEDHLTQYLDKQSFDVVGIGVIGGYYQYQKLKKISDAINRSDNRPKYYILGGHGPSPEPEFFLKKMQADVVVMGEGEETIVALFRAISKNQSLHTINGIAFQKDNHVTINPERPLIEDIDAIPWPAYHLFPMTYYRLIRYPHCKNNDFVMQILSARGCTFKCNFCYRMDKGYRVRNPEAIMEEIRFLQKDYQINYIDFTDELLMSSRKRVIEICEAIQKSKLTFKWFCNGRLNYAKPDILKLMKTTGCVYINYGIEAFDDDALKVMNKALTTQQIESGINATLDSGISPGFNFIFGNIGEDTDILDKDVDFLLKYDDQSELRTIRPVTPYPGSPLYYYAIEKGLLKDVEEFYETKHVNSDLLSVNFTAMSDETFHDRLMHANIRLIKNYYQKISDRMVELSHKLYKNLDANFRGYRQT